MAPPADELLTLVERSPACVAVHDQRGWLEIFTDDAIIEDPVGAPAVPRATGELARFWETFIAPHAIRFEVLGDCVQGEDVLRDVVIHTRVRDGVEVRVPAYLLYQTEERDGARRIRRMAAHWTLRRMTAVALGMGPRAWVAMTGLFARMVQVMGPRWVGEYVASLWRGVGARGVATVGALARAIEAGDRATLRALFAEHGAEVRYGDALTTTPEALGGIFPAGSRFVVERPVAAGQTTAFRFRVEGPSPAQGLALLETSPRRGRIHRARFFTDVVPARAP